jgi:hypothetical protein
MAIESNVCVQKERNIGNEGKARKGKTIWYGYCLVTLLTFLLTVYSNNNMKIVLDYRGI